MLYTVCKPHTCLCITIREQAWLLKCSCLMTHIVLFFQKPIWLSVLESVRFYTLRLLFGSLFPILVSLMVKNVLISSLIASIASLYAFILVSALSFTINSFSPSWCLPIKDLYRAIISSLRLHLMDLTSKAFLVTFYEKPLHSTDHSSSCYISDPDFGSTS